MCVNCLNAWCSYCATRAAYWLTAPSCSPTLACRAHVDHAREVFSAANGVHPTITEIPTVVATGGPQ